MSGYYKKKIDNPKKEILTVKITHHIFSLGFAFIFAYAGITGVLYPSKYLQWLPKVISDNKIVALDPITLLSIFFGIGSIACRLVFVWKKFKMGCFSSNIDTYWNQHYKYQSHGCSF